MAAIRQDKLYRDLLSHLRTRVTTVGSSAIYVAAQPTFDGITSRSIQIIPGAPVSVFGTAGHGLVRESFEIAMWARLNLDRGSQTTELVTNDNLGLLSVAADVRSAMIQTTIDGSATVPVLFEQGSRVAVNTVEDGWGMVTDRYRVGYELAWDTTNG